MRGHVHHTDGTFDASRAGIYGKRAEFSMTEINVII